MLILCFFLFTKGTVEAVYASLQDYLTIAAQLEAFAASFSISPPAKPVELLLHQLVDQLIRPEHVIAVCLSAVSNCKFSVTRRSAGLWPASKAALLAEMQVSPFDQVFASNVIQHRKSQICACSNSALCHSGKNLSTHAQH